MIGNSRKGDSKLFLGLGDRGQPVTVPLSFHDNGHTRVKGPTRFGKGLILQVLLYQMLILMRTVMVIDPRRDDWLPHVLGEYCREHSLPFTYLDADASVPQWCPLHGKSRNQALSLMATGFDIEPHGDMSDFHKLKDRSVAELVATDSELRNLSWPALYSRLMSHHEDDIEGAEGFMYALREYAAERFVQTAGGIDLPSAIEQGGVIYATADPFSDIQMRLLKLLALSVLQTTVARGQGRGRRVELVLDEFKELVSEPTLKCLSLAAGSNTHAYVVHQSLGDISQPVGRLTAEAVENVIASNCRTRIDFQALDPATAEYTSKMSGTIRIMRETVQLDRNIVLNETKASGATLIEDEAPFIHPNVLLSLPERCALLSTRGAPEFLYVAPIPTIKRSCHTTPTSFGIGADGHLFSASEMIDVDK